MYHYYPRIDLQVAFVGQQCAGKTEACKYLWQLAPGTIEKFAMPLYQVNDVFNASKIRGFMQEMSDLGKKYFGIDIFVKLLDNRLRNMKYVPNLYVDDCRYDFELEYLKTHGWYLVYVEADKELRKQRAFELGLDFVEDHPSENAVPLLKQYCDYSITNNTLLTDLHTCVAHMFKKHL